MSKFNRDGARTATGRSAVQTAGPLGSARTHEGAPAHARDAKGELFQLAVVNMVGEDTFYEGASDRDQRYRDLVWQVAETDPEWIVSMVRWLRGAANMRSASVVMAAELTRALHQRSSYLDNSRYFTARRPGPVRSAVDAACQRADEPGEMLAYYTGRYGRALPKGLKRGLADATRRLYSEYSLSKYDTGSHGWRFADVIELVHPVPLNPLQDALFKHAIDRRHLDNAEIPDELTRLGLTQRTLTQLRSGEVTLSPEVLEGLIEGTTLTWENVLSELGNRVDKRVLWEAMIPRMGYMALLRNLRNFDEAGISAAHVKAVAERLEDREQVTRSRQFPYRFLSAYLASASSDQWRVSLRRALTHACHNLPELRGQTAVLVDTSASMGQPMSARSSVSMVMAGALFGAALATRGSRAGLYGFANGDRPFHHTINSGASPLYVAEQFCKRIGEDGHGTNIAGSVKKVFAQGKYDRVIVITDMQTFGHDHWGNGTVTDAVPADVPLYAFNLGGYRGTPLDTRQPNRHEFGGLTDATFRVIPLLERGTNTGWPWEDQA